MDSNEETVQRQVVGNTPGQRSEVLSERPQRRPGDSSLSTATVAIIAILAVTVISAILFMVTNTAQGSANRNANQELASQAPPATIVQQPAQQAPVIIRQPSLRDNARDDANMQEVANMRLGEDMAMDAVSITITDARAILTGTVHSAITREKAEQIVKAIRGVKSVDNQIVVSD
jgi:osmotically-inducible protein OsmY